MKHDFKPSRFAEVCTSFSSTFYCKSTLKYMKTFYYELVNFDFKYTTKQAILNWSTFSFPWVNTIPYHKRLLGTPYLAQ
jgi:hypothetical protein